MGGSSSSSSSRRRSSLHFKVLFGALALAGVIFLFLVNNQASGRGKMGAPTSTSTSHSVGNFKHADILGRDKLLDHPDLDFNYMSKRRVPNGPDPIHNRRTGNSGRPPGRTQGSQAQKAPGNLN